MNKVARSRLDGGQEGRVGSPSGLKMGDGHGRKGARIGGQEGGDDVLQRRHAPRLQLLQPPCRIRQCLPVARLPQETLNCRHVMYFDHHRLLQIAPPRPPAPAGGPPATQSSQCHGNISILPVVNPCEVSSPCRSAGAAAAAPSIQPSCTAFALSLPVCVSMQQRTARLRWRRLGGQDGKPR